MTLDEGESCDTSTFSDHQACQVVLQYAHVYIAYTYVHAVYIAPLLVLSGLLRLAITLSFLLKHCHHCITRQILEGSNIIEHAAITTAAIDIQQSYTTA